MMKIVRQTESELVVEESSHWSTILCAATSLFFLYLAVIDGLRNGYISAALFFVFALSWLSRSTFTFDAVATTIRWKRLRSFRISTGTIHYSSVQAINLDPVSSDRGSVTTWRLNLVTTAGPVMMCNVDRAGHNRIASLRESLVQLVQPTGQLEAPQPDAPPADNPDAARAAELDGSVRKLLQQGRRIDAIMLVQSTDHLDLTEATFRVNRIAHNMKSEPIGQ
jgi:hypothetical protein